MTPDDAVVFVQAFNRLAVATRLSTTEADDAMQQIYFEGLEDLPLSAIVDAARKIEQKAQWFPKVAEWREAAKPFALSCRLKALGGAREEPWHHECQQCEDTGWWVRRCFPEVSAVCGMRSCRKAVEHTYAVACPCRTTNRTYLRRREFQFKSAS